MLQPRLVIDLEKGRKAGSTNKKHKYLARYYDAKGNLKYIWPKDYHHTTGALGDKTLHSADEIAKEHFKRHASHLHDKLHLIWSAGVHGHTEERHTKPEDHGVAVAPGSATPGKVNRRNIRGDRPEREATTAARAVKLSPEAIDPALAARVPEMKKPRAKFKTDKATGRKMPVRQADPGLREDPDIVAREISESHRKKIRPFPAWATAKFYGDTNRPAEQRLLDELQSRPATTLLTLGTAVPENPKIADKVQREWANEIRKLAQSVASAYRTTAKYSAAEKKDQDEGRSEYHKQSDAKAYLRMRTDELVTHAEDALLKLLDSYQADPDDAHQRFDALAYTAIKRAMIDASRSHLKEAKGFVPFEDNEAEVSQAVSGAKFLSPDEEMELQQVRKPARRILRHLMEEMPEAYKRVLEARLWLDPASSERADDAGEHDEQEKMRVRRESMGERAAHELTVKLQKKGKDGRGWTGKGSIASKYSSWLNPETGQHVDLSRLGRHQAKEYLEHWYEGALHYLRDHLTEPEDGSSNKLDADTRAALRRMNVPGVRTKDQAGELVSRYLQLQAKVASRYRRAQAESTSSADTPAHIAQLRDHTKRLTEANRVLRDHGAGFKQAKHDLQDQLRKPVASLASLRQDFLPAAPKKNPKPVKVPEGHDIPLTLSGKTPKTPRKAPKAKEAAPSTPKAAPAPKKAAGGVYAGVHVHSTKLPIPADDNTFGKTGLSGKVVHALWGELTGGQYPSLAHFADHVIKPVWDAHGGMGAYSAEAAVKKYLAPMLNELKKRGVVETFGKSFGEIPDLRKSVLDAAYALDLELRMLEAL
jgi:hypothetical protein